MKVLVVDDVQMARINMRKVLEKEGIEVLEAESGARALKLYRAENPDVVALDIDLPDIDGMSVLKMIKNINENANIIMVTGMSSQNNLVRSLQLGANHFLVKPLDLNKFVQVVKSMAV